MKKLLLFTAYILSTYSLIGQYNEIHLETQFGAKNKEVFEMMRFEGVQSNLLTFSGIKLKESSFTSLIYGLALELIMVSDLVNIPFEYSLRIRR